MDKSFIPTIGDRAIIITKDSIGFCTVEHGDTGLVLSVFGYYEKNIGDIRFETYSILLTDLENSKKANEIETIIFSEIFLHYNFGFHLYDPFESISLFIEKYIPENDEENAISLVSLLWAALEADLFRFTMDESLKTAMEIHHGNDEWWRFAKLNNCYRSIIRTICPSGIIPRSWDIVKRENGQISKKITFMEKVFTKKLGEVSKIINKKASSNASFHCL